VILSVDDTGYGSALSFTTSASQGHAGSIIGPFLR
jgi:hypothetical protein